jgi:hypothetical protein
MSARQVSLFGGGEARIDATFRSLRRTDLGRGAWIDVARGWLSGHEQLFEQLRGEARWHVENRPMYDRTVQVPRLLADAATAALMFRPVWPDPADSSKSEPLT